MPIFWKPVFMRNDDESAVTEETSQAVEGETETAVITMPEQPIPKPDIPIGTPAITSSAFRESDLETMQPNEINERWEEICKALEG